MFVCHEASNLKDERALKENNPQGNNCTALPQARDFALKALAAEKPEAFAAGTEPIMVSAAFPLSHSSSRPCPSSSPTFFTCSCRHPQGRAASGAQSIGLLSRQHIARAPPVQAVLEAPALFQLASSLLGGGAAGIITTGFKWLRAVAPGEFTGVHADIVYVGRGTRSVLTVWIPIGAHASRNSPLSEIRCEANPSAATRLRASPAPDSSPPPAAAGDVPVELGGLLVCRGSHRLRAFAQLRERYFASQIQADGTHSGWISDDGSKLDALLPPGAKADWCGCREHHKPHLRELTVRDNLVLKPLVGWPCCEFDCGACRRYADFKAGDAVVLRVDLIHMSANNVTGDLRLSADTRWQQHDAPRDARIAQWRGPDGQPA